MTTPLPVGPYKVLDVDGGEVPWYIVPFDKEGHCTAPKTKADLMNAATSGDFTDIFLFSHGWNNDWEAASKRYDDFIAGYSNLRRERRLEYPEPHVPLLIGVFWPSTALVAPWEQAPDMAAADASAVDAAVGESQREIAELSVLVDSSVREEFYALMQSRGSWSAAEEQRLAAILALVWNNLQSNDSAEGPLTGEVTPQQLIQLWRGRSASSAAGAGGPDTSLDPDADGGLAEDASDDAPAAAFGLRDILEGPRSLLRAFTVLQMKDRAATVGAKGVSVLLRELMNAAPNARLHMVGHSYGCVVVLSAICYPPEQPLAREVDSLLLLQPAVSRFCFANEVPGTGRRGGYRGAWERVRQPILTTFSRNDVPLTKLFHIAVRRDRDLGQASIAGAPRAPSKYAALGGFGPDGCSEAECVYEQLHDVGTAYPQRDAAVRIIALNGDVAIRGHGDISVPETWWALYSQAAMPSAQPTDGVNVAPQT